MFHYYLPLETSRVLHLNKHYFPSSKDALCQVWLKLAQWLMRRRWKCENFIDRRSDRQTDWRRTTGDQKSSLELSAWWAKKQILFLDHSTSRHQKQKYTLILRTLRVICHKRRENVSRIQISYAQGICVYPLLFIVVVDEVWWGQMGEGLTTSYYLQYTYYKHWRTETFLLVLL